MIRIIEYEVLFNTYASSMLTPPLCYHMMKSKTIGLLKDNYAIRSYIDDNYAY